MLLPDVPEVEKLEAVHHVVAVRVHEVEDEAQLALRQVHAQLNQSRTQVRDLHVPDLPLVQQCPGLLAVVLRLVAQRHEHVRQHLILFFKNGLLIYLLID